MMTLFMHYLRSAAAQGLFYLYTIILCIFVVPPSLLPFSSTMPVFRLWARGYFFIIKWTIGITHKIEGLENVPTGSCIFASKHQSMWDILALQYIFPHAVFISKRELLWIPFVGWAMARVGTIGINRANGRYAVRSLIIETRKATKRGKQIFIFPEGTRTAPNSSLPYKSGVATLYGHLQLPIVPIALNSGLFWPRRSFLRYSGQITIAILRPIEVGLDRTTFLAHLERAIETRSRELVEEANHRGEGSLMRCVNKAH